MESGEQYKKHKYAGIWVVLVVLFVLVSIQLYLSFYLDPYLGNQLKTAVDRQSSGRYELSFEDLQLSLWGRNLQIEKATLIPTDSASTAPKAYVGFLDVEGIRILSYLMGGPISIKKIQLIEPELTMAENGRDYISELKSLQDSTGNKGLPAIEVDHFTLENGTYKLISSDQSHTRGNLNQINITVFNVHLDSTTQSRFPYFEYDDVDTNIEGIAYQLDNELYTLEAGRVGFSTRDSLIFIDSLRLSPRLPKYEFSKKVGHEIDRIDLNIPRVELQKIDFRKVAERQLEAKKILIREANLEVFHDKKMPAGVRKDRNFPHILLKELDYPVTIDTIAIHRSEISYAEHLPGVRDAGKVTFSDLSATFYQVTNDSLKIRRGHTTPLDIQTSVMGAAPLNVEVSLPMQSDGAHRVQGKLDSMQIDKLNPVLEPLGLVRADKGTIHSLVFDMNLGSAKSTGWVRMEYSNLKISVLDKENIREGGSQQLKSFLINTLKINSKNNEAPLRKGEVSFERIPKKSIFNYWWKSLSSGIKDNIGL